MNFWAVSRRGVGFLQSTQFPHSRGHRSAVAMECLFSFKSPDMIILWSLLNCSELPLSRNMWACESWVGAASVETPAWLSGISRPVFLQPPVKYMRPRMKEFWRRVNDHSDSPLAPVKLKRVLALRLVVTLESVCIRHLYIQL